MSRANPRGSILLNQKKCTPHTFTVHLVYPPNTGLSNDPSVPPLSITQLTAYLQQHGVAVTQQDLNAEWYAKFFNSRPHARSQGQIIQEAYELLDKHADLYGFSVKDPSQMSIAIELCRLVKQAGAMTVLGGIVSVNDAGFKENTCIDFLIIDRGELPLITLCEALQSNLPLDRVPNLVYRDGGNIISGTKAPYLRMRDTPPPSFDFLALDAYRENARRQTGEEAGILILPYSFMRGCANRCYFCNENEHLDFKPAPQIIKELAALKARYSADCFFFLNNHFNISYPFVHELVQGLHELGILWADSANLKFLDNQLLRACADSGCVRLIYGLETASPSIIRRMNKYTTLQEAAQVIRDTAANNIWTEVNFIVGFPHESEEEFQESLDFLTEHKDFIDSVSPNAFDLKIHTVIHRLPHEFGIRLLADGPFDSDPEYSHPFDEIDGLPWARKSQQQGTRLSRLKNHATTHGLSISAFPITLLFSLHRKHKERAAIKKALGTMLFTHPDMSNRVKDCVHTESIRTCVGKPESSHITWGPDPRSMHAKQRATTHTVEHPPRRLVVFELDNTLWDAQGSILERKPPFTRLDMDTLIDADGVRIVVDKYARQVLSYIHSHEGFASIARYYQEPDIFGALDLLGLREHIVLQGMRWDASRGTYVKCIFNSGAEWVDVSHEVISFVDKRSTYLGFAGQALLKEGKTDDARAVFDEALRLDANNSSALLGKGTILFGEGNVDESISLLSRLESRQHNEVLRMTLARAYRSRSESGTCHESDEENAIRNFMMTLTKDPLNWMASAELAEIYNRRGQYAPAIGYLHQAVRFCDDAQQRVLLRARLEELKTRSV